ncbi:hypothetical protein DNTS_008061 [Danionella cerebrum]|uniref:Uncharacterized protein n=1 Tax=Danionella cerebrum TaxID=2873325 RepID=A0A553NLN3_9TELE|nr:hypothetical protein DNTS_008061 [Danionella translucida]
MKNLERSFQGAGPTSQTEDFYRACAEEEIHFDDSSSSLNYQMHPPKHADHGEAEKSTTRIFLNPWSKRESTDSESSASLEAIKILPNGTRCSPPASPQLGDAFHGDSTGYKYDTLESELTSIHPAEYYAEKLEVYNLKYSYLKSWPGLLRLLAGLQLLFGGMVFACVCAYVQRDSEWSNYYRPSYAGNGLQGYRYNGPMTAFVLVIVGLSWILSAILVVLGLTMYYRTILLDSKWWPLTEAVVNLVVSLLYMAAGIVYVNDLNRGGVCFMTVGINPILSRLCRVEGGQMAGTAFIFFNMLMYLMSFLVCLKMWRHEATRRQKEVLAHQLSSQLQQQSLESASNMNSSSARSKKISFKDEADEGFLSDNGLRNVPERTEQPILTGAIPTGHIPKPRYQEYKELHREITATLIKFQELGVVMNQLINNRRNAEETKRINVVLKTYEEKRNDPYFQEKKERCEYLKAKLNHIKMMIRDFDRTFSQDHHYQKPSCKK